MALDWTEVATATPMTPLMAVKKEKPDGKESYFTAAWLRYI